MFLEGDQAYLRLQRGCSVPGLNPKKINQQTVGPFTIIRRIGKLACELDLPSHWRMHPVVSIAQLERAQSEHNLGDKPVANLNTEAQNTHQPMPPSFCINCDCPKCHQIRIEEGFSREEGHANPEAEQEAHKGMRDTDTEETNEPEVTVEFMKKVESRWRGL